MKWKLENSIVKVESVKFITSALALSSDQNFQGSRTNTKLECFCASIQLSLWICDESTKKVRRLVIAPSAVW